ncbi:hypothetical protein [Pedobacter sp. R-06]|uniref:hypothetical protein n=1 Tax=Pedobacter sp. R-06 TaxID=3404051 RepID=UPI003CE990D5
MYINFQKYNYQIVDPNQRQQYEARDKEAYKDVLKDWFGSNLDLFVDRKWEIEEIHYLKEIGDFIKLVKEAESLYELAFFTGCIALVGVASEDFSKYLSLKNNRNVHIRDVYTDGPRAGRAYDLSQYDRLKLQRDENIIDQYTYLLLDEIRSIRNDCLHYNQSFKQKAVTAIQDDAIKSLNNLKKVLKSTIGTAIDPEDFIELFDEVFAEGNTRGFEEIIWKHKNMFSHMLQLPIVQAPGVKRVVKFNLFTVTELDANEITLTEMYSYEQTSANLCVCVDLDQKGIELVAQTRIKEGDRVWAEIYSNVAPNGQTQYWFISKIGKINA